MAKNDRYVALGAITIKKEKDAQGRNQYYFKISDDVELTINGRKFTGKYLNVSRPTDKYDRMLEKGKISEDEHEQKCEQFEKGGKLSYISLELQADFKDE